MLLEIERCIAEERWKRVMNMEPSQLTMVQDDIRMIVDLERQMVDYLRRRLRKRGPTSPTEWIKYRALHDYYWHLMRDSLEPIEQQRLLRLQKKMVKRLETLFKNSKKSDDAVINE